MKFPVILLFAACLAACQKDSDSPAIDFGPNGGITGRDVNNRSTGATDPTDWTLDATWNQQEQDLFKDLGLNLSATATGTISRIGAYPNPVVTEAYFQYEAPTALACSFVVVDANYRVVMPLQSSATANRFPVFRLDLSGNNFQKGRLYRLYYVLRNGTSLFYKGHGDLQLAN